MATSITGFTIVRMSLPEGKIMLMELSHSGHMPKDG